MRSGFVYLPSFQVTIIEPGGFVTPGPSRNLIVPPVHPAYTRPDLGSNIVRGQIANAPNTSADPEKAVKKIYELAQLPDPPLRFLIGKDAIAISRQHSKSVWEDADKYESWSEGLEFER